MQNISRAVNIVQTREWYIPYIKYYKVLKQKQADPSVYQLQPQISSSEFELYRNTLIETECTYAQPICFKDIQRFMYIYLFFKIYQLNDHVKASFFRDIDAKKQRILSEKTIHIFLPYCY